jgi:hypothetical protein
MDELVLKAGGIGCDDSIEVCGAGRFEHFCGEWLIAVSYTVIKYAGIDKYQFPGGFVWITPEVRDPSTKPSISTHTLKLE